jgi:gamma-glutamyltranspeptidase
MNQFVLKMMISFAKTGAGQTQEKLREETVFSQDLAEYAPRWLEPVSTTYRGRYTVCAAPPPNHGTQILVGKTPFWSHFKQWIMK